MSLLLLRSTIVDNFRVPFSHVPALSDIDGFGDAELYLETESMIPI